MYKTSTDFERITFDRQLIIGQACIRHLPITVAHIVGLVAQGIPTDGIVVLYPQLAPEDVRQALEYAAWLSAQRVYPHRN